MTDGHGSGLHLNITYEYTSERKRPGREPPTAKPFRISVNVQMYVYTNVDTPPRQVTAEPVKHFTLDQCLKGKTIPWMWIAPGTPLLGARCRGT